MVTIDGRLADSDLEETQRVQDSTEGKVLLNLSGLFACSDDGIQFLKRWLAAGAHLERANPFLRMVFEQRRADKPKNQSSHENED